MSYLVLDLLVLAVIVLFVWRGAAKGFLLSLCGLLAFAVAFGGASIASKSLAPAVAQALEPRLATVIEEQLDAAMEQTNLTGDALSSDQIPLSGVLDVLRDMGLYEDLIHTIDQAVDQGMTHTAANAAAAVAATIAQSMAYRIIFLVAFSVIMAAWTFLSRTLNLVTRLPGIHFLNKTAGALVGLVKAALILFLAAWVLQLLGNVVPEETVQQTFLLRFFMEHTPLSLLSEAVACIA